MVRRGVVTLLRSSSQSRHTTCGPGLGRFTVPQPHLEDGTTYHPLRPTRRGSNCPKASRCQGSRSQPHLEDGAAYRPGNSQHGAPTVPPPHTHHTTGIERPWCVESLPSHISKTVVSTVSGGGACRGIHMYAPIGSHRAAECYGLAIVFP